VAEEPETPEQVEVRQSEIRLTDLPSDPETRMERDALMVMLQRPEAVGLELLERASRVRLRNSLLDVVRDGIASSLESWDHPDWMAKVSEAVPSVYAGLVSQLGVAPLPEKRATNLDKYSRAQVSDLVAVDLSRLKAELTGASQRAAAEGDLTRANSIRDELAALELERRRMRTE
jgi:DNA primase